jgi:transcriptional regulator with XRE-family HTH domain
MTTHDVFRHKLRSKLGELTEKNPRFSLRAFAIKTGLSPSVLSRVLNGKRNLSLKTMARLSRVLELEFNPSVDEVPSQTLGLETFKVLADWYHFPIIELMRSEDFEGDAAWIAKRLGLPLAIVQAALDRLERLDLVERVSGKLKPTTDQFLKTTDDIASDAIRCHHRQMLAKADAALDEDLDSREFQGINISFNFAELPEAKKMIRDFVKKFNRRFASRKGRDVYQLNLQFFNLTSAGRAREQ